MKTWKMSLLFALGVAFCIVCTGCGSSSSKPLPGHLMIMTSSLTSGTMHISYSATLSATGGSGPYTWSITQGTLPSGMTLSSGGTISGTPAVVGSFNFRVQAVDSSVVLQTATEDLTLTIGEGVGITTTWLPAGAVGGGYSAALEAAGGQAPYKWSLASGALPAGLTLSSGGAISGTPTTRGTLSFTVQASDSEATPSTATAQLSITIDAVIITTLSLPAGPVNVAYGATMTATGGAKPYTWSIVSGTLADGLTMSTAGVISGVPTVPGTYGFTVQVADAESTPATATAPLSIVINTSGNTGIFQGNYAFVASGFASAPTNGAVIGAVPWTIIGSLVADGEGNITSGMVDFNNASGTPISTAVTGTYSVSSAAIGTMTLSSSSYTATIAFAVSSDGNGRMIQYDDTTGTGSRGAGVLRKQDPAAFSLATITGGYGFGLSGTADLQRMVEAGYFAADGAGNISDGACDRNDAGTHSTCMLFSGTVNVLDDVTGRGVIQFDSGHGFDAVIVYVVSTTELLMMNGDLPVDGSPYSGASTLWTGTALLQSGPFSTASLSGPTVIYYQDIHAAEGANQSGAMLVTFDGSGNSNTTAADEDLAGIITQRPPSPGTYTVGPNGAIAWGNDAAGFLVTSNKGFFVGINSNSVLAFMEPQTGGPFSVASISGSVAGGSLPPLDYDNSRNEVEGGNLDGAGRLNLNTDSSSSQGLGQVIGESVNYTVAANGRGVTDEPAPAVIYLISPTKFIVLVPQSGADLIVLEH